MKKLNLTLVRNLIIGLSAVILAGSAFLFVRASAETLDSPLFGILVFLLIVDTIFFVFFKIKTNAQKLSQKQAKKQAELLGAVSDKQIVKDQKPHTE